MRSPIAGIRTLILPWGAMTGRRIVLDGIQGKIFIYDATSALVAQIDDSGFSTFSSSQPGSQALLTPFGAAGGAELDLVPATVGGVTYGRATVAATTDGSAEHRPELILYSPNIVGKQFVRLIATGEGVTDQSCSLDLDGNVLDLDLRLNGISQSRGQMFATARATAFTTGAQAMILDAAANFVWKSGRVYEVVIRGRMGTNTAGNLAIFKLLRGTTTAGSTAIDFGGLKTGGVGDLLPINLSALIANATAADITQTVQASLQSSAGTVTHDGGTMPRSITIADVGAIADYQSPGGGNPAYNTI